MVKKYFGTDGIRGRVNGSKINGEMFFKFGLAAGTYLIYFSAGAFDVNNHRAKIETDGGTDLFFGTNARSAAADSTTTHSMGWGVITPSSTDSYLLTHRCSTTRSTKGFGLPCDFASENEYHAQVTIFRIS